MDGEGMERLLEELSVSLVLTAHPTETQRRSIRLRHLRIGNILESVDVENLTPRESEKAEDELAEEITVLWQTDELRVERPEVEDEIRRTLLFFERPLISSTLDVYRDLENELARQFPGSTPNLGRVLEFGSWVGGDQDGNPFVKPETLGTALELHQAHPQPSPGLRPLASGAPEPVSEARGDLRRARAVHRAVRVATSGDGPRV